MSATLRTAAEARLATLLQEEQAGKATLTQLDNRRAAVTDMLLRIDGAIKVLGEVLATPEPAPAPAHGTAPEEPLCPNPNAAEPTSFPSP